MRALQHKFSIRHATTHVTCSRRVLLRAQAAGAASFVQRRQQPLAKAAAAEVDSAQTHADAGQLSNHSTHNNDAEAYPELQLQLPEPTNVLVKSADFIKSSIIVSECPPPRYPEFAVIGRSNVGKSSLINLLTGRKSLAMVSKEPGKTRCINHFLINKNWYLVDLPGYGYARTGKDNRKEFEWFTKNYFLQRPTLTMVFLLVDSSIPPQDVDLEYAVWLASKSVPFSIVFTKADKRKKGQPKHNQNITAFKRMLIQQHGFTAVPPSVVTSASAGMGKQELLSLIASLRVLYEKQSKSDKQ